MNSKKAKEIRRSIRKFNIPDPEYEYIRAPDGSIAHNPASIKGLEKSAKKMAQDSK